MIPLLLLAGSAFAPPVYLSPPRSEPVVASVRDEVFDKRLAEAGKDVDKLWEVVVWCEDTDREKEAAKVLRAIVRIQPEHRAARLKLGHLYHDGQWFTTEKKLEAHKEKEAERLAEERGLVKYRGEWVRPGDLEHLKKGLVRGADGRWLTRDDQRKVKRGWIRQDLTWVAPDEAQQIEAGLWKCGDDWLTLEEANEWHRSLDRCWVLPLDRFTIWTTCDRSIVDLALPPMETGFDQLRRVWGVTPQEPLPLLIVENWSELTGFEEEGRAGISAASGLSQSPLARASFLESWLERPGKVWRGAGGTFWDTRDEHGAAFGAHDVRMAVGLSFADALDPSRQAVEKLEASGSYGTFVEEFYAEKRVPDWFRWGSAAYASRFHPDNNVETGGDPWWIRTWSLGDMEKRGGPAALAEVFEFDFQSNERDAWNLVLTAGLIVGFLLDGDCAPVQEAHAALREVFAKGEDPGKIFEELRKQLEAHEDELRAFAGH